MQSRCPCICVCLWQHAGGHMATHVHVQYCVPYNSWCPSTVISAGSLIFTLSGRLGKKQSQSSLDEDEEKNDLAFSCSIFFFPLTPLSILPSSCRRFIFSNHSLFSFLQPCRIPRRQCCKPFLSAAGCRNLPAQDMVDLTLP